MTTISLDSPVAAALREWLLANCRIAAQDGCDDRLLALYLADAENDSDGLIEIRACDSVHGRTVTYQVAREFDYYMHPATGSVDTLDGWHPYAVDDGLVLVTLDADGAWVEA